MDHLDAENMKAVERYMLGDLAVSEVEEFERHFFDCPQCSEELRALTIFQENARAVFAEQDLAPVPASVPVPKSAAGWWGGFSPLFGSRQWAMALGALLIGIFAGYGVFAPHESAQVDFGVSSLCTGARRGDDCHRRRPRRNFTRCIWTRHGMAIIRPIARCVLDASGAQQSTVPVEPGAPGEAIHMLIPTRQLRRRQIRAGHDGCGADKDTELARFPFTLRFK